MLTSDSTNYFDLYIVLNIYLLEIWQLKSSDFNKSVLPLISNSDIIYFFFNAKILINLIENKHCITYICNRKFCKNRLNSAEEINRKKVNYNLKMCSTITTCVS